MRITIKLFVQEDKVTDSIEISLDTLDWQMVEERTRGSAVLVLQVGRKGGGNPPVKDCVNCHSD